MTPVGRQVEAACRQEGAAVRVLGNGRKGGGGERRKGSWILAIPKDRWRCVMLYINGYWYVIDR